jgi:putative transposase
MRCARLIGEGKSYYHVVSRVIERRFAFDNDEKERFIRLLRKVSAFSGIRILTYALMSNHFHLLAEVDPEIELSEQTVLKRVGYLYGHPERQELEQIIDKLRASGANNAIEELLDRYRYRMQDLSEFMKTLLQRATMSYNGRHERHGTLWEGRFKSTLVEGSGNALAMIAAYIDLNPVRAGIVNDPKDYRYCGYSEAVAGNWLARDGLGTVLASLGHNTTGIWNASSYRTFVFMQGSTHRKGGTSSEGFREQTARVIARKGKLSRTELLHCKVRYFTDGAAFGSKLFIQDIFEKNRTQFGLQRKTGPRCMRHTSERTLFTMRDLRLTPIVLSAT